jgi:hypothetical protein
MKKNFYGKLKKRPQAFRRLTGITVEKFEDILLKVRPFYERLMKGRLLCRDRKRAVGGGKEYTLKLEDKLLMLLMYYRLYITHLFLGFLFGIDDSNVSRNMTPLQPLLAGIFRIPEKRVKLEEDEIIELFCDGTEQQTQRPTSKQGKWYSGKKKRHTIKHQIFVSKIKKAGKTRLRIKAISKSFFGKTHDKKMYESNKAPPNIPTYGDSGYQGTNLVVPKKKPKGKQLTKDEKQYNRIHSSLRVVVEHSIGKLKIWKILSDRFRNRRSKHTLIFKNIAGLQNLMFGS